MSKHTPGPWDYWSGYNAYDKVEAQITAEGGDIVIASYNHLISEGEANARIMAAAPDLLEALEKIVEYAHQYSGRERSQAAAMEIVETPISDDVAAARVAIAKARGEA